MYSQTFAEQPRFFFMHFFMHFWANDDALKSPEGREILRLIRGAVIPLKGRKWTVLSVTGNVEVRLQLSEEAHRGD